MSIKQLLFLIFIEQTSLFLQLTENCKAQQEEKDDDVQSGLTSELHSLTEKQFLSLSLKLKLFFTSLFKLKEKEFESLFSRIDTHIHM